MALPKYADNLPPRPLLTEVATPGELIPPEEAPLRRLTPREQAAIEGMYIRNHIKAIRILRRKGATVEEAEDFIGEATTALSTAIAKGTFKLPSTEKKADNAFLKATENKQRDAIRHERVLRRKLGNRTQFYIDEGAKPKFDLPDPETNTDYQEDPKSLYIEEASEQLSPDQREVFHLAEQEGLLPEEIADALKIDVQVVRNRRSRARKSMRNNITRLQQADQKS